MTDQEKRIQRTAGDGNLDLDDVRFALDGALSDQRLDDGEVAQARDWFARHGALMEPGARSWLQAVLAGEDVAPPHQVLLAPHPRDRQKDLFYARTDVVALQEALSTLGFPTSVDGDYGPGTARQVAALQVDLGLPATGSLDSDTLLHLNRLLDGRGLAPLDLSPRDRIRPDTVIALRGGGTVDTVRAMESALSHLSQATGEAGLALEADGIFGDDDEKALRLFQARVFLPQTGILDTATARALDGALAATGGSPLNLAPPEGGAGFGGAVELHFYPGDQELKVYVLQGSRVLDVFGMVGGKAVGEPDPDNPKVDYSPTPKGTYEVVEVSPHTSSVWAWSYVPYGSHLREVGGEIQFRDGSGAWRWATGPQGVFAGRQPPPLDREDYLDGAGVLPSTWTLNDFGHLRARLKNVATGALQGHMIHPSPSNEAVGAYGADTGTLRDPARALRVLRHSHGCEHIHPRDLDLMIARGYLAPGTRFVVHGYDEQFVGPSPEVP